MVVVLVVAGRDGVVIMVTPGGKFTALFKEVIKCGLGLGGILGLRGGLAMECLLEIPTEDMAMDIRPGGLCLRNRK